MINAQLHRQPVALDAAQHRHWAVNWPVTDWSVAAQLNATFVAAAEFIDVAREYPLVFVRAGQDADGSDAIAPVAVLGLNQGHNLYLEGPRWRADYMPAVLRHYPFCIGQVGASQFALCVDRSWPGLLQHDGPQTPAGDAKALFTATGEATAWLTELRQFYEKLEAEVQRTRALCRQLNSMQLLREMRFDATLPDSRTHTVDGFLTVDQEKFQALNNKTVVECHRNGIAGLVHAHWLSMGHMRRLALWHAQANPAQPAQAAALA